MDIIRLIGIIECVLFLSGKLLLIILLFSLYILVSKYIYKIPIKRHFSKHISNKNLLLLKLHKVLCTIMIFLEYDQNMDFFRSVSVKCF